MAAKNFLPTPVYKLSAEDEDAGVYPPSEDTFLLLDALELDRQALQSMARPVFSLEIGCGSGVVTAFLHQVLSSNPKRESTPMGAAGEKVPQGSNSEMPLFSMIVDVNGQALSCAKKTMELNSGLVNRASVDALLCDLCSPLFYRLQGKLDVLLMNPPYVPTEGEPSINDVTELYYAGGPNGRNLVDKLLPQIPMLLAPGGLFYLVVMKENKVEEMEIPTSLIARVILERQCGIEHLSIWRFEKRK